MTREELEYSISQYLDGTLPPLQRDVLDERLASDAEARAILADYRRLDTLLKTHLPGMPQLAWDRLADEISRAVAAEEPPVRHFSIRAIGWTARLAIAAAVLMVLSLAIFFARGPRHEAGPAPQGIAVVSGPQVEQSAGPVVSQISIGPSPTLANQWRGGEEIVSRPTVVLIDRVNTGQDTDSSLY
ncbi:anti-sigma factor family protein [Fontivita pretiosa]|uniref:anti-sigma factor family protein n=1 Tax=Fontivita pretiosa TaxID=2989684 RepID=UPI003D163768